MLPKVKILIVEDSLKAAYHLKATLETEGYEVMGIQDSGEGTLELLESQQPDLVLMDIILDGKLDGIETTRLLKLKYNLPVIYITALMDKETIQRAKITEPFGYITKPFEDREIFTVIEMALYKHDIELRLRSSEEQYFSTLHSISDAVVVMDQQYNITYLNPSAEVLSEWPFMEARGRSVFDIMKLKSSDVGEYLINPLQCPLTGTRLNALPDNLELIGKSGKCKCIGGNMSPIIDKRGNFIGVVIIFRDITQKIEQDKLIKYIERERLSALLQGQEKERSRIAKDLHDGLGQMLTAIKMNVHASMGDGERLDDLYKLIDEAIQESVRISENLLPSKLRDFDLATCIRSLCNQMNKSSANTDISFESASISSLLDHHQKINFYRIVQEAINNAMKHADANAIVVQLYEEDNVIRLTVEDDGRGIRGLHSHVSAKNGLGNMRERAEMMGGKFSFESDPDRGTLVIVEAPLDTKLLVDAKI